MHPGPGLQPFSTLFTQNVRVLDTQCLLHDSGTARANVRSCTNDQQKAPATAAKVKKPRWEVARSSVAGSTAKRARMRGGTNIFSSSYTWITTAWGKTNANITKQAAQLSSANAAERSASR